MYSSVAYPHLMFLAVHSFEFFVQTQVVIHSSVLRSFFCFFSLFFDLVIRLGDAMLVFNFVHFFEIHQVEQLCNIHHPCG